VLSDPAQTVSYHGDRSRARTGRRLLVASRPFLEDSIRRQVLGLPNVGVLRAQATGLAYHGHEVSGVQHVSDAGSRTLPAGIVIDAMGRGSNLPDWLPGDGYDRPELRRLRTSTNYTTAVFERPRGPADLDLTLLVGYDDVRPGRTLDAFRVACAKLPPPFAEAAASELATSPPTIRRTADAGTSPAPGASPRAW
jgi:hypothetical protein